ncbi:unnamed protein product [Pieris macdunnoughi]|uniref:Kazal-like domain-containing protein n=1 Tax=Pieris macdunnoughi TaxID=345717 RepID=A0A821MTH3_9NEOP|nr:unnamed protein product [Pieris macdunnoughi]
MTPASNVSCAENQYVLNLVLETDRVTDSLLLVHLTWSSPDKNPIDNRHLPLTIEHAASRIFAFLRKVLAYPSLIPHHIHGHTPLAHYNITITEKCHHVSTSLRLSFIFLLMTLSKTEAAARVQRSYGDVIICGSDGYAYRNKCDFDIKKSTSVGLTMALSGPRARNVYFTKPFIKVVKAIQEDGVNKKGLRKQGDGTDIRCSYGETVLCGSDGSTYYDLCTFHTMEAVNPYLVVAHQGPCDHRHVFKQRLRGQIPNFLRMGKLSKMLLAQIINSQITIFCKSNVAAVKCPLGEMVVCGSDGFTYNSLCDLEIVRTVRPNLELHHIGVCHGEGCSLEPFIKLLNNKSELRSRKLSAGKQKKNPSNINLKKLFLTQLLKAQIVVFLLVPYINEANLRCIYGDRPICGSDGVTYLNLCDLQIIRTVHPYVHVRHIGQCAIGKQLVALNQQMKSVGSPNGGYLRDGKK